MNAIKIIKAILFLCCFIQGDMRASVWYVNASASGTGSGMSWMNACTDIATAISNSSSGDEIWVAAGIYKPSTSVSSVYYNLKAGVAMYGGFNGSETLQSQRDILVNTTIVSGDIGIPGFPDDNTYHLFKATNLNVLSTVDGFVIKDAVAYAIGIMHSYGYYGAAALITNSQVKFANCTFANHLARGGGAIFATSSTLTLDQCIFNGNTANIDNGGAIWTQTSNMAITKCNFLSNSTTAGSGTADGGAIYISNLTSGTTNINVEIDRCMFTNNSTLHMGSAIKAFNYWGSVVLKNCLIVGNYSKYGSVVELLLANTLPSVMITAAIENCTIAYNAADTSLLTMHPVEINASFPELLFNSILWKNTAVSQYAGISLVFNCIVDGGGAGAQQVLNVDPQFKNPPIFNNLPFVANKNDYELEFISPGIDAGTLPFNSFLYDLNDSVRIQNGHVDLGCFEHGHCDLPLSINVSPNDTICSGQTITLTGSAGNLFFWFNNSPNVITSDTILINANGSHTLQAIDTITGCRGRAEETIFVLPQNTQTVQTNVCSGSSLVLPNGNVLSNLLSNTIDTTVLTAISGCDSTIITQITVLPTYSTNTNASVCYGSSYTFPNGFVATGITAPFTQPSAFSTIDGCDSTIWTSIIVLPVYNMTVHDTICKQSNYTFPDGTIFTQIMVDTFHVNLLLSSMNCDSTVTTQIHVRSIDTSVSQTGPYFSANATGVSYQWLNCDTQQPISGETNQIFITTFNGNYAVIVSDMYCTDTSSCRPVTGLAINQVHNPQLQIYPNPVLDHLMIDGYSNHANIEEIKITDMQGRTVQEFSLFTSLSQINISLQTLQAGCYVLQVKTREGDLVVRKMVKQ